MSKNSLSQGLKAPLFCLPDQNGNEKCLKDLKGKWVVLYFYPRDNTTGCTKEAQDFTSLKDAFEDEGAMILGVSRDSITSHQKFMEKKEIGITLLSDTEIAVHKLYDVWRLKKFMGKESMGTVRTTFLIDPEGNIAEIWDNVKTKDHAQAVLNSLRSTKK
ncbi:Peroxiredoxin [Methanomethylovorans hollandica DSM 15978]|uniref:thioredoxin-dependent peroxiredoxin n=1 Tax=Methanomethylovorans hollandica (strain DSM 15978 / NBRC 107637 / DMS1) TaxID=867904 RepID=L0KVC0_METHD|nr:thioredoxin-dependent thiol peroxidase [Methanomethylovorans hollandica]AGB49086.1 Peroxiredoxin [Methanomethylovorans hollandica DSM 15978]